MQQKTFIELFEESVHNKFPNQFNTNERTTFNTYTNKKLEHLLLGYRYGHYNYNVLGKLDQEEIDHVFNRKITFEYQVNPLLRLDGLTTEKDSNGKYISDVTKAIELGFNLYFETRT